MHGGNIWNPRGRERIDKGSSSVVKGIDFPIPTQKLMLLGSYLAMETAFMLAYCRRSTLIHGPAR